MSAMI
jgi:MFS family permease